MDNIYKVRLLKLAHHLEFGKLGHKVFDMGVWNTGVPVDETGCGPTGCAIGECPIAFPDYWQFRKLALYPELIDSPGLFVLESGCQFFGLENDEFVDLFVPSQLNPIKYTAKQQAHHIQDFVAKKYPHPKVSKNAKTT